MRKLYIAAAVAAMLALAQACSDDILTTAYNASGTSDRVCLTLDVSVPAAATAGITRAVTNDSTLNGQFAVFAFSEEGTLLWTTLSDATNTDTNLKGEGNYENFTGSPSITWHPDGDGTGTGRLYIEADENEAEMSLLVITNVDSLAEKFPAVEKGMTKEQVIASLSVYDFAVTDDAPAFVPMAGEVELDNGITLGATGVLRLRRSLAKIIVNFVWNDDYYTAADLEPDVTNSDSTALEQFIACGKKVFIPDSIMAANINSHATVYSPYTDVPCVPTADEIISRETSVREPIYDTGTNTFSTSVEMYVPETKNTKKGAFGENNVIVDDPRISIFLIGTFYESDGTKFESWYRLDLIPETGSTDELDAILRNTRYTFNIENVSKRGSTGRIEALRLTIPDNYRMETNDTIKLVTIDDDDLLSITIDYDSNNYNKETNEPFYIAVSSTDIEMPYKKGAVARVRVETNVGGGYMEDNGWDIDFSGLPSSGNFGENPIWDTGIAFSFIYDKESETLWVWLDYPELVNVGETYVYYITAGNIRKKMRITIVPADEDEDSGDTGDDSSDTGGD